MTIHTNGADTPRPAARRRQHWLTRSAVAVVLGLLVALVPSLASQLVSATSHLDPAHVQFTLEGCRGSVGSFPADADDESDFVCPDSQYTTGNLGPGWNELDLVPHRLTTKLGTQNAATTTYQVNITADAVETGTPGYDYISVPVINEALSHASCEVVAGDLQTLTPGIGGTDESLYRTLTITQDEGTTCVFDYVQRLAVGASGFSGSSLHSNLTQADFSTGGVGARDVSIPVKPIQPQSIHKDMTATQGAAHVWNVTKSATPATLNFADTCSTAPGALSQQVQITVSWEKLEAEPGGDITVVTNIYATNPAHRSITVNVVDKIYSGEAEGGGTLHDTKVFDPVAVPANTANHLVGTHQTTVPAGTTDLNDVAAATYTDEVTNIPVPGTTEATASATVQQSGSADNATATITDVEDITGTGLSYSVDSFTPNVGGFDGGYTEGTETDGEVSWTSDEQSDDGSVTFTKTVYVDEPRITSGTLSDVATLTGSDGFETDADADVAIISDATTTLTIDKTIPNILEGDETVTFTFNVHEDGSNAVFETQDITFTAGETNKSVTFSLPPGVYDVKEVAPAGWVSDLDGDDVDLILPTCDATLTVTNSFGPGTAQAVKISDPEGAENGWVMCLEGPGTEGLNPGTDDQGKECATTETVDLQDGLATFTTPLQEGSYTITEKPQASWDQTDAQGCSFEVNYPEDFDAVFTCTITNVERGTVTVIKTSSGQIPVAGAFSFEIREGASATEAGTVLASDTNDATGTVDFDTLTDGLVPGDYQLCETGMLPGWHSSLSDEPGAFVPDSDELDPDNSVVCVPFTLDPGEEEELSVDNTPPPGGDARTIGFWRNWSSCTNGNQDDVLDQTLASAGGILIGDLLVDTCQEAVAILAKSSLDGTKRASDPAFNLAAQLLAAFLNVEAEAGSCPAADAAMTEAQQLLADADFDGSRTFGGSSTKGKKKAQAPDGTIDGARANELAGTLDAYNNNELC